MKDLIASIDMLASNLEDGGFVKEALQLDIYSNTLEFLDRKAFHPFESKPTEPTSKPEQIKIEPRNNFRYENPAKRPQPGDTNISKGKVILHELNRGAETAKEEFVNIYELIKRYIKHLDSEDKIKALPNNGLTQKILESLKDIKVTLLKNKPLVSTLAPDKGGL